MLRSFTTNLRVPTTRIITNNGKNFISQKPKADGFVRLYMDVSRLMLEKHERRMKKALSSRLWSEMVDPDAWHKQHTRSKQPFIISIRPKEQDQTRSIQGPFTIWVRSPYPCWRASSTNRGRRPKPSWMESRRHQTNAKRKEGPTEDGELLTSHRPWDERWIAWSPTVYDNFL